MLNRKKNHLSRRQFNALAGAAGVALGTGGLSGLAGRRGLRIPPPSSTAKRAA